MDVSAAALGIDIGSSKSVLAAVRKGGIDIINSDTTNKQTPMVVAFTEEERLIGDAAMNQQKKNFKNTLQFFNRFIGLNIDCVEQLKQEEQFTTYKIVPLANKKIGFEVEFRGVKEIVTPEQVLAYYLKKTKTFFEFSGISSNEVVLSVPTYFSNVERQGVLDAAEIAGLKCLRLINESTAIALNYGFFRKGDLPDKDPRYVVFVDLGHSKVTVTIASFVKGKMRIVITKSDRNLGARNMDSLLVEKLGEEFFKKFGADPRNNVRARLRMLDVIEKQRKILSGNKEATIHLEALLEDEDLHKNLKREDFEVLIMPMIDRFTAILQEVLDQSGLKKDQIHSVEMVGDATRIPIVQQKCKDVYGVEQVSRTLNSLECVARGASLQAAMLSPLFKVADYEVQEYNSLPVSITYSFPPAVEGEQAKAITKELFPVGSSFPSTKTITFDNKKGGLNLLVHYSENADILPGLPREVSTYTVKEGKPKHNEKVAFILRISNNIHQVPCLESADLQEEYTEEEKIPIKKDVPAPVKTDKKAAPADEAKAAPEGKAPEQSDTEMKAEAEAPKQEFEIRKKQKKISTALTVDSQSHAMPQSARSDFTKKETAWFDQDQDLLDFKAVKNELESFSYELKNNIDAYGAYEAYIEPAVRDAALKRIQETITWIYGEGETATTQEYRDRFDEFKKIGYPVKKRYLLRTEFPIFQEQFKNYSQEINDRLAGSAIVADSFRSDIMAKYTEMESYFTVVNQILTTKATFEDTGITIDDVQNKFEAFKIAVNALFSAAAKQSAEAFKAQETAQQTSQPEKEADVEMKEEGAK